MHLKNGLYQGCSVKLIDIKSILHSEKPDLSTSNKIQSNYSCNKPETPIEEKSISFFRQDFSGTLVDPSLPIAQTQADNEDSRICESKVLSSDDLRAFLEPQDLGIAKEEIVICDGEMEFVGIESPDTTIPCPWENCTSVLKNEERLEIHLRRDHATLKKCHYKGCGETVKSDNFQTHVKLFHWGQYHVRCKNCKKFFNNTNITRHYEKCTSDGIKRYACPIGDCKSAFTHRRLVKIHQHTVHAEKIKCPYPDCNVFLKPVCVRGHVNLVHKKETGYGMKKCENCQEIVKRRNYKKHLAKCHVTKEPATVQDSMDDKDLTKCPFEFCNIFTKLTDIRLHLMTYHREVKKICLQCGKSVLFVKFAAHYMNCVQNSSKSN